jgi:hypothetical protein
MGHLDGEESGNGFGFEFSMNFVCGKEKENYKVILIRYL